MATASALSFASSADATCSSLASTAFRHCIRDSAVARSASAIFDKSCASALFGASDSVNSSRKSTMSNHAKFSAFMRAEQVSRCFASSRRCCAAFFHRFCTEARCVLSSINPGNNAQWATSKATSHPCIFYGRVLCYLFVENPPPPPHCGTLDPPSHLPHTATQIEAAGQNRRETAPVA